MFVVALALNRCSHMLSIFQSPVELLKKRQKRDFPTNLLEASEETPDASSVSAIYFIKDCPDR